MTIVSESAFILRDNAVELVWPGKKSHAILPLFLPHMGCRHRCAFCSQEEQSGRSAPASLGELADILQGCEADLRQMRAVGRAAPELAFYGGTFTALPDEAWNLCLEFAQKLLAGGLISSWRCSTRPDALPDIRLRQLAESGCGLVELGIQSFHDPALILCRRGHDGAAGKLACERLHRAGIRVGVHLMPGLPGTDEEIFLADADQALACDIACLRLHPCLVLKNTALEKIWLSGAYSPWPLEKTIRCMARVWLKAQLKNVPVIRMGLAPEPSLSAAILAGPVHPAIGSMTMAYALFLAVEAMTALLAGSKKSGKSQLHLYAPRLVQGYIWGNRGNMRQKWLRLGLGSSQIHYQDRDLLRLEIV